MNAERLHITKSIHLFASQHDKTQQTSSQEGEETEIASSALSLLQGRPIVWVARRAAAWTRSLKINPVFTPTMSCESSVIIPIASWPIWARWRIQGFATPLNQVLMFSFLSLLVDFNLSSIIDPLKDDERWKTKAYTFFGSFGSSAPQNVKFITRSDRMNWWHHSKPVCPPVGVCWLQSLVKHFPTFPSSTKLPLSTTSSCILGSTTSWSWAACELL